MSRQEDVWAKDLTDELELVNERLKEAVKNVLVMLLPEGQSADGKTIKQLSKITYTDESKVEVDTKIKSYVFSSEKLSDKPVAQESVVFTQEQFQKLLKRVEELLDTCQIKPKPKEGFLSRIKIVRKSKKPNKEKKKGGSKTLKRNKNVRKRKRKN